MSDRSNRKALKTRPTTYEVGYAKPPVDKRFKPGQSGNPKGRPKGALNRTKLPERYEQRLKTIILEEAYRMITINDADGRTDISMAQAVMRSLAVNAAKGNQRAQRLFTELLASTERENMLVYDEWFQTAVDYKVQWDRELSRRARLGITGEEPLPHPDHVIIDVRSGSAHVRGPATKEEKAEWDLWRERQRMFEEELVDLHAMRDDPECTDKEAVLHEIERTEKVLAFLGKVFDPPKLWEPGD